MSMYLDIDGSTGFKEDLEKAFDKYLDFMKYEGSYQKHEDKRICQIKGAYLEMDKALYEKTFCEGIDHSGKFSFADESARTKWANAYVFSNHNPFEYKQEMKDSLMKKKEVETIANHYSDKLNEVFRKELKLDNYGNNTLLLGENAKTNFYDSTFPWFRDYSTTDIDGSVYFMDKNEYKSDFILGKVTFWNHAERDGFGAKLTLTVRSIEPETVKYVKVNHHFSDHKAIADHYRAQDIDAAKAARANN